MPAKGGVGELFGFSHRSGAGNREVWSHSAAWYPGQAGGTAVAEVLFGDYNPAGRLPVTFYRNVSQLPDFEDYNMTGRTYRYMTQEPLFPSVMD